MKQPSRRPGMVKTCVWVMVPGCILKTIGTRIELMCFPLLSFA